MFKLTIPLSLFVYHFYSVHQRLINIQRHNIKTIGKNCTWCPSVDILAKAIYCYMTVDGTAGYVANYNAHSVITLLAYDVWYCQGGTERVGIRQTHLH